MWLVEPCLDFIHHHCKAIVQTSSIHLTYSLMKLYTCLLGKYPKSQSFYSFFFFFCSITKWRLSDARNFLAASDPMTQVLSHRSVLTTQCFGWHRAFMLEHWCHYRAAHGPVSIFHTLCLLSAGIRRGEKKKKKKGTLFKSFFSFISISNYL